MTMDLETRLRTHLGTVEHAAVADPNSVITRAVATGRRRDRRRRVAAAGTCVGLVVLTVAVISVNLSGRDDALEPASGPPEVPASVASTDVVSVAASSIVLGPTVVDSTTVPVDPPTTPTVVNNGAWEQISPDPRGATSDPATVWDGREILVVGGQIIDDQQVYTHEVRGDAMAYSPATDSWRPIANPPTFQAINSLAVWTGTEMLVIGGDNPDGSLLVSGGIAYNPSTDTWRTIASPPEGLISASSPSAWTGTELLVWPSTDNAQPVAYNPVTDRWRGLTDGLARRRRGGASVWTGSEWLVWGGAFDGGVTATGVAYDPATSTWRDIAPSPLAARLVSAVWTGTEMLIAAGRSSDENGMFAFGDGAAYNPSTDTWRRIADGPAHPGAVPVWTGSRLLIFFKGAAMVYDEPTDDWITEWNGGQAEFSGTPLATPSGIVIVGSWWSDVGGAIYTPPT